MNKPGRPTEYEEPLEVKSIRLTATQAQWLKDHGGLSVAVRKLIDEKMKENE